jgi:hypothetical protein
MASSASTGREPGTRWNTVILVLAVLLTAFFFRSFVPGQTLFSNDGPLGRISADYHRLPDTFAGAWNDLNFAGYREQGALTSITYGLRLIFGPVIFSKFYAPLGLLIAGLGAWCFFRACGLAGPACVLGAIAAALNTDFFSTACWGIAAVPITVGMSFFAMAALIKTAGWRGWARTLLAGLAVGMGVADGADVGAIFSIYVAAFLIFEEMTAEGNLARRLGDAAGRLGVVVLFAALLAAQPIFALVDTQINGVFGMDEQMQTREQHWDWATQWSLPKREALSLIVPGLFGYRVDTPGGANYWGEIGRDAAWVRYFESHQEGKQPPGLKRFTGSGFYAGVVVVMVALWAALQSLLGGGIVFDKISRNRIWFWMGVLVVSLLLGFGRYAPFYRIVYGLPFFSTIRNPIKFIELVNVAFVVLFAYGADGLWRRYLKPGVSTQALPAAAAKVDRYWLRGCMVFFLITIAGWAIYASRRQEVEEYLRSQLYTGILPQMISQFSIGQVKWCVIFMGLGGVLMAVLLRRGFQGRQALWGAGLLGLLVFLDYYNANYPWVTYLDYHQRYADNPVLDLLATNQCEHRVSFVPFKPSGATEIFPQIYRLDWMQHQFQHRNIQSLDLVQMPRLPEDMKAFMDATQFDGTTPTFPHLVRRYELTSTRYLLCSTALLTMANKEFESFQKRVRVITQFNLVPWNNPEAAFLFQKYKPEITPGGEFSLVEFSGALPRAKLCSNWQCSTNDKATLAQIADPQFDPSQKLIVSGDVPAPPPQTTTNAAASDVTFVSYAPKKVVLKADAKIPSVLLLNDRYDPNWRVSVDGKASALLHCNYLMRGVYLEPGSHVVEFRFLPPTQALYVSLAAISTGVLLLGIIVFPFSPGPVPKQVPPPADESRQVQPAAQPQTMSKKARRRANKTGK